MRRPELIVLGVFATIMVVIFVFSLTQDDSQNNGFDHYKTDVHINLHNDGSATISETYDFRWSGEDSGEMYRTISDDEAGRISSVTCTIDGVPAALVPYDAGKNAASSAPLYSYGWNQTAYSNDWEINAFYQRAYSGEHTVTFQYNVSNAVTKYSDCIEFYYKVFEYFSNDLKDLTVTVNMPTGSLQNETYIFGHGDSQSNRCEFIGGTANSIFVSPDLAAYSLFEIRVVSKQTSLYPQIPTSGGRTFDSIMAEEKNFRDTTDLHILLANIQLVLIIMLLLGTILLVLLRFKFFKRNKPTFNHPYTREIPSVKPNIEAEFGSYYKLFKGNNFGNKIAAAILSLALNKAIAIEKVGDKEIAFVSLNENVPMSGFEKGVYSMLFSTVRGKEEVRITLTQLKKDLASRKSDNFNLSYTDDNEFAAGGYVDSNLEEQSRKWNKVPMIPLVLAVPIIAVAIYTGFSDYIPYFFGALVVSFLLVGVTSERTPKPLTVAGEDEYAKAKALKKFYTDMTLMKERRAMELPLWEQHLVYATALGVADKVIKELDVRFAELKDLGLYTPAFTYLPVMYSAGLVHSMNSISRAPYAAFVRSAGPGGSGGGYNSGGRMGGGGGFSGGGGGGFGGGGGGHR